MTYGRAATADQSPQLIFIIHKWHEMRRMRTRVKKWTRLDFRRKSNFPLCFFFLLSKNLYLCCREVTSPISSGSTSPTMFLQKRYE